MTVSTGSRTNLRHDEFYVLCRELERDPIIRNGGLTLNDILIRHRNDVPGRELAMRHIKRAIKATNLTHFVKYPPPPIGGNLMRVAFLRIVRLEELLKQVCTKNGIDASVLDKHVSLVEDRDGKQS